MLLDPAACSLEDALLVKPLHVVPIVNLKSKKWALLIP